MKPRSQQSSDAVRRGHSRLATVTLHSPDGAAGEVPVYSGYVGFDLSSGSGPRYGQLEVPGKEWFDLFDPRRATWVEVSFSIEGESWDLGQFPVKKVEDVRPGGPVRVQLQDWAARRARLKARVEGDLWKGATLAQFFYEYMRDVMPGQAFSVVRDDTGGAAKPYVPRISPGGDVWAEMRRLAESADAYLIVTSLTTGEIRRYDPYAPYHDDLSGTINRSERSWDMDEVVNEAFARVFGEGANGAAFQSFRRITSGPLAFDRDGVGFANVVEHETVPVATQAIADARAKRLYDRRAGAVMQQSLRVVPQPWLEPGDVIVYRLDDQVLEQGCIEQIEYPLRADGAMTIRTRGLPVI